MKKPGYILFLLISVASWAQEQNRVLFDLSAATNPQYFQHAFDYRGDYVSLARVKGRPNKASVYKLSSRSQDLELLWDTLFNIGVQEHIVEFFRIEDKGFLLKNGFNEEKREKYLCQATIDLSSRKISPFDTLQKAVVNDWFYRASKAKVKQDFHNAVQSIQFSKYTTPLEYKYALKLSPDSTKIMVYSYDYSQKNLCLSVTIFNSAFEVIDQGKIPVDDGHISYGLDISNRSDVIMYKVSESGRVVAVRSKLNSKKFNYVDLYTSNSKRDNLKLIQQDTSGLYLAKINRKNESFVGVTFSRFDFEKEEVTETHYQAFDQAFKNQLYEEMKRSKVPNLDKNWYHYELTDFIIDKDSNRLIIVEERNVVSTEYEYRPESVETPLSWNPIMGRVKAGILLLWVFDKYNKLIYKHGFLKNQDIDATDGLNTISYHVQLLDHGELRFIMAAEGKSNALNQIRIKEIDYVKQKITRDELLQNTENLVLTRPFTQIKGDFLYYVGRKGLLGKKSYLVKYKL